jgi:hypothetical protein
VVDVRRLALLAAVAAIGGCAKKKIACFDVAARDNSAATEAVFEARNCQGGGETWSGILHVLAARRGRVESVPDQVPGFSGGVYMLNSRARFSIDGEGEVARFCADDPGLLAAMRADYQRLNTDAAELKRAMAGAKALEIECDEADGTRPKLPEAQPPPELPAATVAATQVALNRLKRALARQPAWCFPPNDDERRMGVLRFAPDGRVTWTALDGKQVGQGRWSAPPAADGDDRIEVNVEPLPGAKGTSGSGLFHFDLGPSGRIGYDLIGTDEVIRTEMIPGDGCLAPPAKR